MARNYRTSQPQDVDFMYQLPENLMMKVIQNADAQVDQSLQTAALYGNAVKIPYLEKDKDAATQWTNQWNSKIDEVTATINQDPANWRKHMSAIKDMGRAIQKDITKGDAARIQSNYNARKTWMDDADKQVEEYMKDSKKGISPQMKQAYLNNFDNQYKGFKDPNGIYSQYTTKDPVKIYDPVADIEDKLKEIKPDGSKWEKDAMGQWYAVSQTGSKEKLSKEKIAQAALPILMANQQAREYYGDGTRVGFVPGTLQGNPFVTNETGKLTGFNPEHAFTPALSAVTSALAFEKTESGTKIGKENAVAMEGLKNAHDIAKDARQHAYKIDEEKVKAGLDVERDRQKAMNDFYADPENRDPATGGFKALPPNLAPKEVAIPVVGQQLMLKNVENNELQQVSDIAGLKKQREVALKSGASEDVMRINAQIYNKEQDVNASRKLANDALRAKGYTNPQIAQYNDYVANKNKFEQYKKMGGTGYVSDAQRQWDNKKDEVVKKLEERNRLQRVEASKRGVRDDGHAIINMNEVVQQIGPRPGFDSNVQREYNWFFQHKDKVNEYSKMSGIQSKAKVDYYKDKAARVDKLSGVVLEGEEGNSVKTQVGSIIASNPDAVDLIDPATGKPAPITVPADFQKDFDIKSVVSYQGTSFKVTNKKTNKEYLIQVRGNNNIDHLIRDAYRGKENVPGVDRLLKEISNTTISSMMYETGMMTPGESKIIPIGGGQVRVVKQPNGNYSGYRQTERGWIPFDVKDSKGKTVPLVNYTREALSDAVDWLTTIPSQ